MSTAEALEALHLYGLAGLERKRPCGITLNEAFHAVVDIAKTDTLDSILEECLGLVRHWSPCVNTTETDEQYRRRSNDYFVDFVNGNFIVSPVNYASPVPIAIHANCGCSHSWKLYQGLMESYEYCALCDEKKK